MTTNMQNNEPQQPNVVDTKQNDKEINFRKQEMMFQRQLEQERQRIAELERKIQEQSQPKYEDEDDDDEPYIDKRKLKKELAKVQQTTVQHTQSEIQRAVQVALEEKEKQDWIKQNGDFYDVIQRHAEEFAQRDPELAETILKMPQGFAREKLVYRTIKSMGLDKPKTPEPSIQQKIDANRRSAYYQPSGIGNAPYSQQSDYSPQGQKSAYDHMQALKNRLRLN